MRLTPRSPSLGFIASLALLAAAPVTSARDEIVVRGSSRFDLSIERFQGQTGEAIRRDLGEILRQTGYFNVSENGPGAFLVRGAGTGAQLSAALQGPQGQTLFQRDYRRPNVRANVRQLADDIVIAVTGSPGIASSLIAFVSGSGRGKEICLCDFDGGNIRQLTHDGAISVSPSISRRAGLVAYTSDKSGYPDVYTIDLASGVRSRIINAPGTNGGAAMSPEGQRIALTMSFSGNKELYLTNKAGARPRALRQTPWSESSPTWSPDGTELIYTSDQSGSPQLYRLGVTGGTPQRLPTGEAYCTEPDWSPDGRRLAFSARRDGRIVIGILDLRTGATSLLGPGEDPSWGPDSRHLVYTSEGALMRVQVDTGASLRLAAQLKAISEPSWSRE